jgi:PPM family protein phosphatase
MSSLGRSTGLSHPGRRRRRNEDAWVCHPPLFAVADGMGGARGGEIASRVAATALGEDVDGSGEARVVALIQEANRQVYERAREDSDASGMGTTITVALFENGIVSIGHVGDSRAYLVRDGRLEQLTEDHSLVGELMRSGKLSAEEAETHPQRSVITRALGTDPDVDVDMFPIEARSGDLFLICSDGLSTMVDDDKILELVEKHRDDLEGLVKALIKAANRGGGEDNITVVAFDITDDDSAEQTAVRPAPEPAEVEPDEEDTLTEADEVPVVDTMVVSADEIAAAYEQQESQKPRKRRRLTRVLSFLVVIALLVGVAFLILWGLAQ